MTNIIVFAVIALILIAWNLSDLLRSREPFTATEEPAFPQGEANFITKPYESSVAQCHLTTGGCLKNVRWKEPITEIHTYDPDIPTIKRSGSQGCSSVGTTSCFDECHP